MAKEADRVIPHSPIVHELDFMELQGSGNLETIRALNALIVRFHFKCLFLMESDTPTSYVT